MKTHIVIHHSATPDGRTFNTSAIRRYHTSFRIDGVSVPEADFRVRKAAGDGVRFEEPWRNIGYHYMIEEVDGGIEVIVGRWVPEVGAHCKEGGMNQVGVGICIVGNFDVEVPDVRVWTKARELVRFLMASHVILSKNVLGHREAQALAGVPVEQRKTCPGRLWNMERFRQEI